MKILAIVQARMSSSRLPGKVLKKINGSPLIFHLISRLKQSSMISDIIVATSKDNSDIPLSDYLYQKSIKSYQGDLNNVFERFYQISQLYPADLYLRITGDCPLIDPQIIDHSINQYIKKSPDIAATNNENGYPRGFDVEVFSTKLLDNLKQTNLTQQQKEHVTLYVYQNYQKFKIKIIQPDSHIKNYSQYRFCVDTADDLKIIEFVYQNLNNQFSLEDIIKLINQYPDFFQKHSQSEQKITMDFDSIEKYNYKKNKI